MTSLSVSLPQIPGLQPKTSALATAVPCLKVFPPLARTRTVTCWPDPVQPTEVEPEPWATPEPAFWVTVTKTSAKDALQVTSSGTSTAAPRATSVAGDSTWTSRNSPPEKNATAGPPVANSASTPPTTIATTAAATLVRSLVLIDLPSLNDDGPRAGTGRHGAPAGPRRAGRTRCARRRRSVCHRPAPSSAGRRVLGRRRPQDAQRLPAGRRAARRHGLVRRG